MRIFLFAFVLPFLLPFMINSADATIYNNPIFGFSIDYPTGWDVDDELFIWEGRIFPVSFLDDADEYGSSLDVQLIEEKLTGRVGTDQQELELISHIYQGYCDSATIEIDGYVCSNFKIEYSKVLTFDTHKEYEIKTTWEQIFSDETYYEITNIIRSIPSNSGTWYLYSETLFDEDFLKYEDKIYSTLDSFTLPESELILKDNSSLLDESGYYVNDRFGFSIIPPSGWIIGDENMQIEGYVFPISFHNPIYDGLVNPTVTMMYMPFDENFTREEISKKDFLEEFKSGFLEGFTADGSKAKTTFENIERFDIYDKITLRLETTVFFEGVSFLTNYEVIAWMFENGEIFVLYFVTDFTDFDKNFPDFRKSVNSLEFFSTDVNTEFNISGNIPNWVRNNAGWWAEDLINDSDFVAGVEYLITAGVINVQTTTYSDSDSHEIPSWVKINAGWWANEMISDNDFLKGIKFMLENGIIQVQRSDTDSFGTT